MPIYNPPAVDAVNFTLAVYTPAVGLVIDFELLEVVPTPGTPGAYYSRKLRLILASQRQAIHRNVVRTRR